MIKQLPIILASNSPRRRELLTQIEVAYTPLSPDIDESVRPSEHAVDYALRMAREKSVAGWLKCIESERAGRLLLAADTSVVMDDVILGKPLDAEDAAEMLSALSGRAHQVMTAIAVTDGVRTETENVVTEVRLRELTTSEITTYIASGEAYDKAGAYGIQGLAATFVAHVAGSYSGVMGLPLFETARMLATFGYPVSR